MRKKKYHLYLTAEERRYVFNALIAYRNKLLAQGRYTDLIRGNDKAAKMSLQRFQTQKRGARYKHLAPQSLGPENGLKSGFFTSKCPRSEVNGLIGIPFLV